MNITDLVGKSDVSVLHFGDGLVVAVVDVVVGHQPQMDQEEEAPWEQLFLLESHFPYLDSDVDVVVSTVVVAVESARLHKRNRRTFPRPLPAPSDRPKPTIPPRTDPWATLTESS